MNRLETWIMEIEFKKWFKFFVCIAVIAALLTGLSLGAAKYAQASQWRVANAVAYCRFCGEPMQTKCPHCDGQIGAADDYCPHCGKFLKTENDAGTRNA